MNKIFNEVRIAYQGQILSTGEITALLAEMPKSNDCLFLTTLVKFGCLTREGKGKYKFTSNPIHISLLNRVMDEIVCKHREYSKKHYNKSAKVVEEKSPLHLCSKQGYISKSYETIVCLPNKIVIKLESNDDLDVIVG